ncbi:MAG: tetratricopeptide repeat protein [Verrucomicrobia bacterium]|nr:tetratricopeptide repeat protein [Verrucomicrobiota bacterium]
MADTFKYILNSAQACRGKFPSRMVCARNQMTTGELKRAVLGLAILIAAGGSWACAADAEQSVVGSVSCKSCHEQFYKLWSTSHHGLAMQPYTAEFARKNLTPQPKEIKIGSYHYRADIEAAKPVVHERGPGSQKDYAMVHVMGGKNVYYFLTPLERGKLQVLPVAYDVRKKQWIDTTASALRHFSDRPEQALHWRDRPLTFNTSCFACHVSQLAKNYDLKTDTYQTVWAEPGINCETCHGPASEHVRLFANLPKGQPAPKDIKLHAFRNFTTEQRNALCATCHAKMHPITDNFQPGDRFFDHYGLAALEHPDFYPDGRDLGENYTYTSWRMSPCAKSGKLDCTHCHTSSGRNRFEGAKANNACLPCHASQVKDSTAHSHHAAGSEGNKCVACHMPMTMFARMARSDHSMLPPTPATTLKFNSPNACNMCHADKDAAWSNKLVRQWYPRDYQAPLLHRAGLIDGARKRDWKKLSEMLTYITKPDRDEIFAASLMRLIESCEDPAKWPALRQAANDPSPLVRSAAVTALGADLTAENRAVVLAATGDDYRLVRVQAGYALASVPRESLDATARIKLERATAEFEASLRARPDDHYSHYNMGNYLLNRGKVEEAVAEYELATKLEPTSIPPLVNVSLIYARQGRNDKAEAALRQALKSEPASAEVNFNLGLLVAEKGDTDEAEKLLRQALKSDPTMAAAAYNLGVLVSRRRPDEAVELCRKAAALRPTEAKYGYTAAFYMRQRGDIRGAIEMLQQIVLNRHADGPTYGLLGQLYEEQGSNAAALSIYRQATADENLPERDRQQFALKVKSFSPP